MALISLRQMLDHAAEHDYGVPAFNINNMEQVLAIMEAADQTDSPVIMQASRGARSYAGDVMIRHMVAAAMEMYPDIPVVLHQDHGNNSATCVSAMQQGFSSVMMDGSLEADAKTPASYEYNVEITAKVTDIAHEIGVSVEGELGCLGSLETGAGEAEDGHGFEGTLDKDMLLTDPDQAVDFVQRTKVDALAVAIGTSHGAYKFTRKPTGDILAMNVVQAINEKLPNTHLVMHGSSSGIRYGVRKVNIDTDCRMAISGQFRKVALENRAEFDPRKFQLPGWRAMRELCRDRFERFNTAGQASKIKIISLPQMAARYQSNELDPQTAQSREAAA